MKLSEFILKLPHDPFQEKLLKIHMKYPETFNKEMEEIDEGYLERLRLRHAGVGKLTLERLASYITAQTGRELQTSAHRHEPTGESLTFVRGSVFDKCECGKAIVAISWRAVERSGPWKK